MAVREEVAPGVARERAHDEKQEPTSAVREREPLPGHASDLPPLPAAAEALLDDGLERLGLSGGAGPGTASRLPEGAREALVDHARLLIAWTAAINLTAIREPEAIVREHILDSLAAVPILRMRGIDAILDIGSGGGFPGLPIAIALPAERALLVESIGKKARFLETVVAAVGIRDRVRVAPMRAEELAAPGRERGAWPAVTARAVSGLADLAELALPLLAPRGIFVAWKRVPVDAELRAAAPMIAALGGGRPVVLPVTLPGLEDHILIVIEKVGPTPPAYPRDPARRRRARG